jgi:hypothetical protein
MPPSAEASVVLFIKILVIMVARAVAAPIGIPLFKIIPVVRIALIPRIPLRRIPDLGSDNIGGRIGVIRGPATLIAEKLIHYPI